HPLPPVRLHARLGTPHPVQRVPAVLVDELDLFDPVRVEVGPAETDPGLGGLPIVENLGRPELLPLVIEIPPGEHRANRTRARQARTDPAGQRRRSDRRRSARSLPPVWHVGQYVTSWDS